MQISGFYLLVPVEYTRGDNGNNYCGKCVDDVDNDNNVDNDDNGLLSVLTLRQRLTHSVHTACYHSSVWYLHLLNYTCFVQSGTHAE